MQVEQQAGIATEPHGQSQLSALARDFIAGGVAGALAIITTQPLDIIRVRQQQQCAGASTGMQGSVVSCLQRMVRKEGLLSPWKGMGIPLAFSTAQNAVIFQIYGWMMRRQHEQEARRAVSTSTTGLTGSTVDVLSKQGSSATTADSSNDYEPIPTAWQGFVAGCAAGFGQTFLWSPVEVVKLRLQLQTTKPGMAGHMGPGAMLRRIVATDGVAGLYRGFTITLMRDIPSYGVYFATYHSLVGVMEGEGVHPEDARPATHVVAGGLAGCTAWTSIYGLDVIKSRMQAHGRVDAPGKTWVHYAREVWREGGVRVLCRGLQPTLARAFIMDAAAFLGYAHTLKLMSGEGEGAV